MPIASKIAATQAANFSDNHNASTRSSLYELPTRFFRAVSISALFLCVFFRNLKTIFRQCGSPCCAFYKFQKGSRRIFVLGVFQNNRPLLKVWMHSRRSFSTLSITHGRGNCQRQRDNSCLGIPRLHKLCRLRTILSVDRL